MRDLSDSAFHNILSAIFDMVLVNLCFILCSIPIVTVGASVSALYRTMYRMQLGEGTVLRDFFTFFKKSLRLGIPCWIIWLICFAVAAADFFIIGFLWESPLRYVPLGILVFVILLLLICGTVLFSTLSYCTDIRSAALNSLHMGFGGLFRVIPACILNLIPVLLLLFWMYGFYIFIVIMLLIWLSLSAYVSIFLMKPIFRRYYTPEE